MPTPFTPTPILSGTYRIPYGRHPKLNGSIRYGGHTDPPLTASPVPTPAPFTPTS